LVLLRSGPSLGVYGHPPRFDPVRRARLKRGASTGT